MRGTTLEKRGQYEKEAARLAKLPRAERFEELIDFPARHMFKLIGQRQGLSGAVRAALAKLGFTDVIFVERQSAQGRYASLTFHLQVNSGERLDAVYSTLERIPGVAYLL